METQKKNIQSIINKIGKMHKNRKNYDPIVKSPKFREKKKNDVSFVPVQSKTFHIK